MRSTMSSHHIKTSLHHYYKTFFHYKKQKNVDKSRKKNFSLKKIIFKKQNPPPFQARETRTQKGDGGDLHLLLFE